MATLEETHVGSTLSSTGDNPVDKNPNRELRLTEFANSKPYEHPTYCLTIVSTDPPVLETKHK